MLVPASAAPAFAHEQSLIGKGKIADDGVRLRVEDDRTGRNVNNEVLPGAPRHLRRPAFESILSFEFLILPERRKSIEGVFHFKNNIAAPAAISAIGTTARDEFFAAKMYHPVTALPGADVNFNLVSEHAYIINSPGMGYRPYARQA